MRLIHNSRLSQFRSPFGAVEKGTDVTLSVLVEDAEPRAISIDLRVWIDGKGETIIPLRYEADGYHRHPTLPRACTHVVPLQCDGDVRGLNPYPLSRRTRGPHGGRGRTYSYRPDAPPPVTVYRHRAIRPSWYERGMVYQIFPDRYRRDAAWRERAQRVLNNPKGLPRRIVEDWDEPPCYERAEDGSIASWDFYGGSLKGITADLDRLAEMGITAIYLNPIFEAASNHRYDTADYLKIDPMLGTEDDFRELCEEAGTRGISIILDGVFNHTGDDWSISTAMATIPSRVPGRARARAWRDAYHLNEDGTYCELVGHRQHAGAEPGFRLVVGLLLGERGHPPLDACRRTRLAPRCGRRAAESPHLGYPPRTP